MDARALLVRLAEVIDAHDWEALSGLLHPDFTCRLVHTGEVFDRDTWVRLNADYPGFQRMVVEDVVADGGRAVIRATVTGIGADGSAEGCAVASFARSGRTWSSSWSRSGQTSTRKLPRGRGLRRGDLRRWRVGQSR